MPIFAAIGTLIISLHEYTRGGLYSDTSDFGIIYTVFSLAVMMLLHDTYFYWAHRLMHLPALYNRIHRIHHLSLNPSPWAAFSFHPFESLIEASVLPIIIVVMPVHMYVVIIFLVIMTGMNVLGHLGYELYPSGFTTHPFWRWFNTSTHHNMHHRFLNCNYGLYFNWWDRLLETNHPLYSENFEAVKRGDHLSS
jgi:sterol desaturase/sphingolipid hydroxylase (fatty acid hydroxylase superfamily)